MKPQKIAILLAIPDFNWNNPNSAVANYLKTIGKHLNENGFEVCFYPNNHKENSFSGGNSSSSILKEWIKSCFRPLITKIRFKEYFSKQKRQFSEWELELGQYDVIIEFLSYGSTIGQKIGDKYGTKLVLIYDSPLYVQFQEMYKVKRVFQKEINQAEEKSLKAADHIICYSNPVKDFLLNTYHLSKPITIIPCVAWKGITDHSDKIEMNIGFIGSFLSWHKVELLVKAFEQVADQFIEAKLVLIGKGEECNKIYELVALSKFKDRITMTGFVTEQELEIWKNKLAIAVMPGSNWYGSPLKIFEYMEAGIPVIAPETPTVMDLFVANKELLFIDKNDELNSLSNHLSYLLANPDRRNELAWAGQQTMKTKFEKGKLLTKFVEIINQLG